MSLPEPEEGGRGASIFWVLADQGIVSLGTFVSNILLARALFPEVYGIYVLLLGVVYLLNGLHSPLVVYPLTLATATAEPDAQRRLSGAALCLTLLLMLPWLLGVVLAAALLASLPLVLWVAAALLAWQLQETLRRSLIAQLRHREAVWGDALSYLGQSGAIWWLVRAQAPPLEVVFALITTTSLLGATLQAIQVRPGLPDLAELPKLTGSFWRLGRWTLLSSSTYLVQLNGLNWSVACFHGPATVAAYEAVNMLLKLANPLINSIGNLIIPAAARAAARQGQSAALAVAGRYGLQVGALLVPYFLLLLVWPEAVLRFAYGHDSPYLAHTLVLRLWVIFTAMLYLIQVLVSVLLACGRTRANLLAELIGAAAGLGLGVPLIARFELLGAAGAFLLACAARLGAAVLLLGRRPAQS